MPLALPKPGAAPALAVTDTLFRRLGWITLFRLAVVTVLLGAVALLHWRSDAEPGPTGAYALILGTYAVSLALALALRARRNLAALAYVHIAFDVAIAAGAVALTGGADSPFVFMFSLAAVSGSILLYRRGAAAATSLAIACYLPLALSARGGTHPALLTLFAHASAFAITAALACYLAEQLRSTGERLAARETDLATITALHESVVQSVSSGIVTLDAAGHITFLNHAGEQITGLVSADVCGHDASRWFAALQPAGGRDEAEFVNARGERLRLGYTIFPLVGRGGGEIGSAIIFQDLTQLRAMEAQVQRSERLADLGRLAAGLAHELRNPLAAMTGSIELLRGSAPRQEDARLMDIVLREAERLNELVARFLEFSRPRPPRRERVDLGRLLVETLEVFTNDPVAARVQIERDLAPTPAWCDADQVRQVVWNLLLNAAQAAGDASRTGKVRIGCAPGADGGARLVVEDDGPGIASRDLARIFTPFFTTKERGTGLGLATVQRAVDAHHGSVAVDSAPGSRTRFVVTLPPADDGAPGEI